MHDAIQTTDELMLEALDLIADERYGAALPILARIVAFEPEHPVAFDLWVLAHIRLGRFEKTIELTDAAVARGFFPSRMLVHKATALGSLDRYEESLGVLDEALAIDPKNTLAIRLKGGILNKLDRVDEALAILLRAARELSDDEELHFDLVEMAAVRERHDLVVESARTYLRQFGKEPRVLVMLGHAYVAREDYKRADRAFRDSAALEPDVVEWHVNVLIVAFLAGNIIAAQSYLEGLAEIDDEMAALVASEARRLVLRNDSETEDVAEP